MSDPQDNMPEKEVVPAEAEGTGTLHQAEAEATNMEEAPTPKKTFPDARTVLEEQIQKSKMQRRASRRATIAIVVILGLGFAAYKYVPAIVNSDPGEFASADYLVAVKETGEASQAVLIGPDGKQTMAPDYVEGASDQAPVWSPDGQRVYFVSDRDKKEPHIFRWNPSPGKLFGLFSRPSVERRSLDSRAKTNLSFVVPGEEKSKTALLVSGGTVLEFDPTTGESKQVLPPPNLASSGGGEEGRSGQLDAIYAKYGTGFLAARWMKNKAFIVATMRMEDGGEMLLEQNMLEKSPPQLFPYAGDHIDFDVDPVSGDVVIAIAGARFLDPEQAPEEMIKNGKAVTPFRHAVLVLKSTGEMQPLIGSPNDTQSFARPKVSPMGLAAGLMAVMGKYDTKARRVDAETLYLLGPAAGTEGNMKGLARGKIYDYAWHPNGQKIAFTMFVQKHNKITICSMNLDGSESRYVTANEADYRYPSFSPQLK